MKLTKLFAHLLSKLIKNKGFLHKILAEIQIKGPNLGIFGWRKPEGGDRDFQKSVFVKNGASFLLYLPKKLVSLVTGKKWVKIHKT